MELQNDIQEAKASKCDPLLRFNPLNLAKIACFAKWVKGAKFVFSDFLYKKGR